MVKEKLKIFCSFIYVIAFTFSCVGDIDFEQANEFEALPVIESSLIFFDEQANKFLDNGSEIINIQDFVLVDFFNDEFVTDNLLKSEFKFEIINSINRDFELQIDFFDETQLQHTFTLTQGASLNNDDVFSSHTEVFEGETLEALKRTRALVFTLRLLPGSPIDENTLGRIQLKSLAVFYFKI